MRFAGGPENPPRTAADGNGPRPYILTSGTVAQEDEGEYLARVTRHEDGAARAYRGVYDDLGLTLAVHDDGTLDASWSLGGEVLQPGTDTNVDVAVTNP